MILSSEKARKAYEQREIQRKKLEEEQKVRSVTSLSLFDVSYS